MYHICWPIHPFRTFPCCWLSVPSPWHPSLGIVWPLHRRMSKWSRHPILNHSIKSTSTFWITDRCFVDLWCLNRKVRQWPSRWHFRLAKEYLGQFHCKFHDRKWQPPFGNGPTKNRRAAANHSDDPDGRRTTQILIKIVEKDLWVDWVGGLFQTTEWTSGKVQTSNHQISKSEKGKSPIFTYNKFILLN